MLRLANSVEMKKNYQIAKSSTRPLPRKRRITSTTPTELNVPLIKI